jgi:hypothetical protein
MSDWKIAKSSAAVSQVPDQRAEARWLTTRDAGRALHLTNEGVRHLVRDGKLRCEWTPSHRRIFLAYEVLALVTKRAKARLLLVPPGHHARARSSTAPRQLQLFHVRLAIVPKTKVTLDKGQAKDQRSRGNLFDVR